MANPNKLGYRLLNVEVLTAAGGSQSDAATVPSKSSPALIIATGDGVSGIILPKASKGMIFYVKNIGVNALGLFVYPAVGHQINALGTNTKITMSALTAAIFVAQNSTQWYTFPLLPS